MEDLTKLYGDYVTSIKIGDRLFEMKPINGGTMSKLAAFGRKQAIKEFYETSKELNLPFDLINSQFNAFNRSFDLNVFMTTMEGIAYLLHLRSGVPFEEIMEFEESMVTIHSLEIMNADIPEEVKKKTKEIQELMEAHMMKQLEEKMNQQ